MREIVHKKKETDGRKSIFGLPFSATVDTNVCLIVTLGIAGLQAMNITVNVLIAITCWVMVFVLLLDLIWRERAWSSWTRKTPLTLLAVLVTGSLIYRAYKGPSIEMGTVAVYFGDDQRYPAATVPFMDLENLVRSIPQLIADKPARRLDIAPGNSKKVLMNVIVRNTSGVPIQNAEIAIMSNVPIEGKSMGSLKFSDRAVSYPVRTIRSFSRLGEEDYISIEFEAEDLPVESLFVMVDGDNMKPYAGVGIFQIVRHSQPTPQ